MKKKAPYLTAIAIVVFIALIVCFRPLSLSDVMNENQRIVITLSEPGVRNGEPYIDFADDQSITEEQQSDVLALLQQYTYRRTPGTFFSDGSISGGRLLSIYAYDDTSLVGSIFVSSSGKIAVNGKSYAMKNADRFIDQMIEIME